MHTIVMTFIESVVSFSWTMMRLTTDRWKRRAGNLSVVFSWFACQRVVQSIMPIRSCFFITVVKGVSQVSEFVGK